MNNIIIKHNRKGQFVKGDLALVIHANIINKLRKGVPLSQKHRDNIGLANKGKTAGHIAWNKGKSIRLNTGRTHFKKGQTPHNFKGGISKTKEYRNFYKSQYKFQKRNAVGYHTFGEWETLKAQYNYTCPCCHKSEPQIKLTEDHIIPLSKGGSNNIENIQPLCQSCNSRKWAHLISKYE